MSDNTVCCCDCGREFSAHKNPPRWVLMAAGWKLKDGVVLCPSCAHEVEKEEKMMKRLSKAHK